MPSSSTYTSIFTLLYLNCFINSNSYNYTSFFLLFYLCFPSSFSTYTSTFPSSTYTSTFLLFLLILLHSSSSTYTTPILLFYLCVYLPPLLLNLVLLLYSYNPPLVLYTSRYLTPYWWKFPFNLTPNIINTELCKQNKPVLSL